MWIGIRLALFDNKKEDYFFCREIYCKCILHKQYKYAYFDKVSITDLSDR